MIYINNGLGFSLAGLGFNHNIMNALYSNTDEEHFILHIICVTLKHSSQAAGSIGIGKHFVCFCCWEFIRECPCIPVHSASASPAHSQAVASVANV